MDEQRNNYGDISDSLTSNIPNLVSDPECEVEPQCEMETDDGGIEEECCVEQEPQNECSVKHQITINTLDYGYTVKVGCQNFAFETSEQLVKLLGEYLKNPQEMVMTWTRTGKFK